MKFRTERCNGRELTIRDIYWQNGEALGQYIFDRKNDGKEEFKLARSQRTHRCRLSSSCSLAPISNNLYPVSWLPLGKLCSWGNPKSNSQSSPLFCALVVRLVLFGLLFVPGSISWLK